MHEGKSFEIASNLDQATNPSCSDEEKEFWKSVWSPLLVILVPSSQNLSFTTFYERNTR